MNKTTSILLLAVLCTVPCEPTRAQSPDAGTVYGTVSRLGTSEPIAGAVVTLTPQASPGQAAAYLLAREGRGPAPKGSLFLANDGITVLDDERRKFPGSALSDPIVTDGAGRFAIENVPAGAYAVNAQREGYFGRGSSQETPGLFDGAAMGDMVYVTMSKDQHVVAAMLLIPAATIRGSVAGPDGMPRPNQDVRAFRVHGSGDRTTLRGVIRTSTDERGNYRLHPLPPGDYFIGAGLGFPENFPNRQETTAAAKKDQLLLTFSPSATDPRNVPAIAVRGGEDLQDRAIRIQRGPIIRVSGEIANRSSIRDLTLVSVDLVQGGWTIDLGGVMGGLRTLAGTVAAPLDAAGADRWKFEFSGVFPPGTHELRVIAEADRGRRQARGRVSIEIGSRNVEGVVVILSEETH
jgi:hypothetical protein